VWCRAKWPSGVKGRTGASPTSGGYINLGGLAGLSGERDTSSCALRCSFRFPSPLTFSQTIRVGDTEEAGTGRVVPKAALLIGDKATFRF